MDTQVTSLFVDMQFFAGKRGGEFFNQQGLHLLAQFQLEFFWDALERREAGIDDIAWAEAGAETGGVRGPNIEESIHLSTRSAPVRSAGRVPIKAISILEL